MITQAQPDLAPLSVAREKYIPRNPNGRPVNPSTVWRWIRKGLEGLDGERIRLQVVYRGNAPYVTAEAVQQFFAAMTHARLERMRRTLERSADVTEAELAAAGLIGGRR
jgi:hypothetical protein